MWQRGIVSAGLAVGGLGVGEEIEQACISCKHAHLAYQCIGVLPLVWLKHERDENRHGHCEQVRSTEQAELAEVLLHVAVLFLLLLRVVDAVKEVAEEECLEHN